MDTNSLSQGSLSFKLQIDMTHTGVHDMHIPCTPECDEHSASMQSADNLHVVKACNIAES